MIGRDRFFLHFIGCHQTLLMSHDLQSLGMKREFFTVGLGNCALKTSRISVDLIFDTVPLKANKTNEPHRRIQISQIDNWITAAQNIGNL